MHGTEVSVEIIKTKEESDHVQFLIKETSGTGMIQRAEINETKLLSLGLYISRSLFHNVHRKKFQSPRLELLRSARCSLSI